MIKKGMPPRPTAVVRAQWGGRKKWGARAAQGGNGRLMLSEMAGKTRQTDLPELGQVWR